MSRLFRLSHIFLAHIFLAALLLAVLPMLGAPVIHSAHAADPAVIGRHGVWTAYQYREANGPVCYMAAKPQSKKGAYKTRDEVFALVTHRPAEKSIDVFTYIAGYTYKPGSEATVTVNGRKFVLFTSGNTAWAPDEVTDRQLMEAIRKGSTMVVQGVSQRGTKTTDSFSLKGSGAAHDAINKACNIP